MKEIIEELVRQIELLKTQNANFADRLSQIESVLIDPEDEETDEMPEEGYF